MIPTPWKNPPEGFVAVGEVLTTQGIKGEVRVSPLTSTQNRWKQLQRVFAYSNEEQIELSIESTRLFRQFVIVKFQEINSIEQAENLHGLFLWIPRAERPPLPENSFYIDEIVGLQAYNEAGTYLGTVEEIIPTGANDVFCLRGGHYGEILLPALKALVLTVDIPQGKMSVRLPAGLVEEEE